MAYQDIVVGIDKHIGMIRLNRPTKKNALNASLRGELIHALAHLDDDDDVKCLILTGNDEVFSAGADIKEMCDKSFVDMFKSDGFAPETRAFQQLRKPIIAAVAGPAFGGGCELAMMCDIIIAADNASFGQPETNLGVIAGLGGTQRLTRAIGKSKSMEMHLSGRVLRAKEAERAGLVSRVVELGKLTAEVNLVAEKIVKQSLLATMAAKEAVNQAEEMSLRDGLLFERRLFHSLFATEDQTEGMSAFVDRRESKFRSR